MKKYAFLVFVFAILFFLPMAGQAVPVMGIDLTNDADPNIYTGIASDQGDGSIWKVLSDSPTGTGNYQPFLGLKAKGSAAQETGMNTNALNVYDDHRETTAYVVAVKWSEMDTTDGYYTFTFDLDEPGSGNFISIDTLRLYSGANDMATSIIGLTPEWSLLDKPVLIDQFLASSGNGKDDIMVQIPYFSPSLEWMYLYVQMGGAGIIDGRNFESTNGFEEVRAKFGPGFTVPEPTTLLLLGLGLLGLGVMRKKI